MAYRDLREFMQRLEREGELRRVTAPVSPRLEMTAVVNRVCKRGGPAVLFEQPTGFDLPVLMNAFGSRRRMALALEVADLDEIAARLDDLLQSDLPRGLGDKLRRGLKLLEVAKYLPKVVGSAPCQEIVEHEPRLSALPVLTCWPQDGGPFITLPQVFTRQLGTGRRNVGM